MSKKNNVNPDHYKTAGRERQGEDIVHDIYKRRYTQSKSHAGGHPQNFIPGAQEEEKVNEDARRTNKADRKAGKGSA